MLSSHPSIEASCRPWRTWQAPPKMIGTLQRATCHCSRLYKVGDVSMTIGGLFGEAQQRFDWPQSCALSGAIVSEHSTAVQSPSRRSMSLPRASAK